jgi:hypothetical protein
VIEGTRVEIVGGSDAIARATVGSRVTTSSTVMVGDEVEGGAMIAETVLVCGGSCSVTIGKIWGVVSPRSLFVD